MNEVQARNQIISDWEEYAATFEGVFCEPDIVDHFERLAATPGNFDAVLRNLSRDLDAQPWLLDAGYGWVVDRSAYRFAQEAINQGRVLNALGGLLKPDDLQGQKAAGDIVSRQRLRWRIEDAEPYCGRSGKYRFIVIPFGWDNAISLLLLALRSYLRHRAVAKRLFTDPPPVEDWQAPAKGLLLTAVPIPEARMAMVDSFLLEEMRKSEPWFSDAIISIDEFEDDAVRSLWAISSDWVVGHEVSHALHHLQKVGSLEREMEADLGGLLQLMSWARPKDLSGLSVDLSPNFWDYFSARIGLMMLTMTSELHQRLRGRVATSMANDARARSIRMRAILLSNLDVTTISSDELKLLDALDENFDQFLTDLAGLHAKIPAWSMARVRQAARKADLIFREELADHQAKGGGPILPDVQSNHRISNATVETKRTSEKVIE